jgi:alkylation response protein AidB-like acyl-CoA dehydrogenase
VAEQAAAAVYLARTGADPALLAGVLDGKAVVSVAVEDAPSASSAAFDGARLSGDKVIVPWGAGATVLVVFAQQAGRAVYVAVDATAPGVVVSPLKTMTANQNARVRFNGAPARLLGSAADEPGSDFRSLYTLARDAYTLGLLERMLEISGTYAQNRVQFGRPIATFQAIAHRCADIALAVYGVQSLVYQAAWLIGAGKPARIETAMCHAYIRDHCAELARHAHQIHGAMGFTTEYPLQIFSRRAKTYQVTLGSAADHREVVATAIGNK